jgi:tripartite-type tricarboxylate transporter receptor subunit TctC
LAFAASCAAACLPAAAAPADEWPSKPVKVIVSLPPGSGADTIARYVATQLQLRYKQPFVVENRTGANSFIAAQYVAKAPADGYTLFWASNSPMTTNLVVFKQLPYDPVADFTPIAMGARFPMAFVVAANSPVRTMADLTAYLRKSDGKANYGSGTATYRLAIEQYHLQSGVSATHVPYKGTSAAVMDLAAGSVDFSLAEVSAVTPLIKGGKLRALAVTGKGRQQDLPDVPTMAEAGIQGYEVHAWVGGFFPAKVDQGIVDKAANAVLDALNSKEGRDYVTSLGGIAGPLGPRQLREFQEQEITTLRAIAQKVKMEQE